jgi:patatin-like phospholipase/acyl hydrolase
LQPKSNVQSKATSRFSPQIVKALAEELFTGQATLSSAAKYLLMPALQLDTKVSAAVRPVVFHNMPGDAPPPSEPMVDLLLRATATPTRYPSYQNHVDASLYMPNPAYASSSVTLPLMSLAGSWRWCMPWASSGCPART